MRKTFTSCQLIELILSLVKVIAASCVSSPKLLIIFLFLSKISYIYPAEADSSLLLNSDNWFLVSNIVDAFCLTTSENLSISFFHSSLVSIELLSGLIINCNSDTLILAVSSQSIMSARFEILSKEKLDLISSWTLLSISSDNNSFITTNSAIDNLNFFNNVVTLNT